jgi:PAP2 superfamily protein
VQTVSLSWQHSGELAVVLAGAGGLMALSARPRVRAVGAFFRETAVIGALYGLWHLAGQVSVSGTSQAFRRAHWIRHVETFLPLPSERSLQQAVIGHHVVIQGANLYYASMHLTTMLIFLIWLFVRHRDRYRPVRQVMAWTTLGCLLIQLVPVAPPRMTGGIIDTGLRYGQSVYSNGLAVDQLSAMPSVHVAWAVLVGYYVWRISPSRWRFLGPLHALVTVLVVVVTGNHWWLDGIAAVGVLAVCAWGVFGVRTGWRHATVRWRVPPAPVLAGPEPVTSGAGVD